MPTWAVIAIVVVAWLLLAVLVGLAVGAVIRRRDRQVGRPAPPDDEGPGPERPDSRPSTHM